jgi:hypothetical protein
MVEAGSQFSEGAVWSSIEKVWSILEGGDLDRGEVAGFGWNGDWELGFENCLCNCGLAGGLGWQVVNRLRGYAEVSIRVLALSYVDGLTD